MSDIILCTQHLRIFINYKAIRKKRSKLIYRRSSQMISKAMCITTSVHFLCGQGEFEQAYSQFNAALAAPNYYHQADTYENIAPLCFCRKTNRCLSTSVGEIAAKLILLERKSSVHSTNHCQKTLSTLEFSIQFFVAISLFYNL